MSTRTPHAGNGLTVQPLNPESLQYHASWGQYAYDADPPNAGSSPGSASLPNSNNNPLTAPQFVLLEVGDTAVTTAADALRNGVYVCVATGSIGGGDAEWRRLDDGGAAPTFVFRPTAPTAAPVYGTIEDLMAAVAPYAACNAEYTIVWDTSTLGGPFVFVAGTYAFGDNCKWQGNFNLIGVELPTDVVITGVKEIAGFNINATGATSPFELNTARILTLSQFTTFGATTTAAIALVAGFGAIAVEDGAAIVNNGFGAIEVPDGETLHIFASTGAQVGSNSLIGGATSQLVLRAMDLSPSLGQSQTSTAAGTISWDFIGPQGASVICEMGASALPLAAATYVLLINGGHAIAIALAAAANGATYCVNLLPNRSDMVFRGVNLYYSTAGDAAATMDVNVTVNGTQVATATIPIDAPGAYSVAPTNLGFPLTQGDTVRVEIVLGNPISVSPTFIFAQVCAL